MILRLRLKSVVCVGTLARSLRNISVIYSIINDIARARTYQFRYW